MRGENMALPDEQQRRLNNLASASKGEVPTLLDALNALEVLQDTYAAFQSSGLTEANIVDDDFVGDNDHITRTNWLDFMFAVGTQNNTTANIRTALLALLDSVPL